MPNIGGKNDKNTKKKNPSVSKSTQALPPSMSESKSPTGVNNDNTRKKKNKKKPTATTESNFNSSIEPTATSASGRFVKNTNANKTMTSKIESPPSNTEHQLSASAKQKMGLTGNETLGELVATLQRHFINPKPTIPRRPQPKFTVTAEMRQKIALLDTEQPECVELSSDEEGRATNTNSPSTSSKTKPEKLKSRDPSSDIEDPDRYSPSQPLDLPEVDVVLNDSDDGRESPESPVYSDEEQEEDKEESPESSAQLNESKSSIEQKENKKESLETSAQEEDNKVSAVTLKLLAVLPSNNEGNGHSLEHIIKIMDHDKYQLLPPDHQAICRMAIAKGVEGTFIGEVFCNRDLLQVAARSIFQSLYPEEHSEEKENFKYLTYAMGMSKRDFLGDYNLTLLEQAYELIINHGGKGEATTDLEEIIDFYKYSGGKYWTYDMYEKGIFDIYQMLGKDNNAIDEVFKKHGQQLPPAVEYALKGYKLLETNGGPQMQYQCKPIMEFQWTERG
ncbi:hypothetical protein GCK72_025682 [Caenorhabditis remanei]|uniref:Uncharacterized protein n=1 Tax=Caenorhabditis remanei TaxID=31234 RepID=A0A6A5G3B9_CAERE|nr:hypothetical protein GCK72_025682 [Caenorhabditis remanei]KAF1749215.1 hypothetical protein GCK72_025682 [Caenorhabditis remanei]